MLPAQKGHIYCNKHLPEWQLKSAILQQIINGQFSFPVSIDIQVFTVQSLGVPDTPFYYIKYLLEQLVTLIDEQGNIEQSKPEPLMPWSKNLPDDCYSKRR